jgi:response regulator RpfG family c-di-GMP phosphodiesterase
MFSLRKPPTKELARDEWQPLFGALPMGLLDEPIAVLVVEDEPLVLMDVAATIREGGFRVYEAVNADQAVELLEEYSDIRVLFTDVDMDQPPQI